MPAILVIAFRRPTLVERLLDRVLAGPPARIYVACDGPRPGLRQEADAVAAVRCVVQERCKAALTRVLFHDANLGCGRGVSTAISWFFEHESEGIILEDDCLPDASFFPFCAELLERYRDVAHVMQIAGHNPLGPLTWARADYVFSNYGWQWGWATWRRAWHQFDLGMAGWPRFKEQGLHRGPTFPAERIRLLDATCAGHVDTWDYQWAFAMASQSGLSVVPRVNLVANVGFDGPGGTHYGPVRRRARPQPATEELQAPLRHPEFIYADPEYDRRLVEATRRPSLPVRAWRRLRAMTTGFRA